MSYTDEVIRFIQDYDNGSMWDEFVVAFEDIDDANLDASDIIDWMQNYPDMYDAFLTEGDDYNDEDDVYEALNRAHELDEAAFSGGMAGDNSASGGTIRGRGASTQPGKNNYLNRMKSKNPDLVDTMVIKVSDIKPGMITQAGQVKEAEARNHTSGGKKMYIMHTNGYDGFWGLDETMDVMVDPENESKPFAGDYRALLKMGLQESEDRAQEPDESHDNQDSTSSRMLKTIDVFAEAKNRMPFVTSTSGTNENFEIVFEDDMTGDTFYIRGKLVNNRYDVEVEVHENRRSLWGYRTSVHFWNMNPLSPKSLCTLFDRWDRAYLASGQKSGHMRLAPVFKGWNASLRLGDDY